MNKDLKELERKVEYLSQFVLDERRERIHGVSMHRTRYIKVVLEDIYYAQNASAVVRSCDCFGIQELHFIHNESPGERRRIRKHVALGAEKWVSIHRHHHRKAGEATTERVLKNIKNEGYRIIATSPDQHAVPLEELDLERGRIALVMGNEQRGVSARVREMADETITIPMLGFSESFNISVSTALILQNFSSRLRASSLPWRLSSPELTELRFLWLKKSIPKAKEILKAYEESL